MKRSITIIFLVYCMIITILLVSDNNIPNTKVTDIKSMTINSLYLNPAAYITGRLNDNSSVQEYLDLNSNINETLTQSDLISDEIPPKSQEYNIEDDTSIKSFMDYKSITSRSSRQYQLQQNAYTSEYGIRKEQDRYCVALGSYFTTDIGTYIDIILQNGTIIHCILADCKADKDTDNLHIRTMHDGSIVEFVVDTNYIDHNVLKTGDISKTCPEWESPIIKVIIYEKE